MTAPVPHARRCHLERRGEHVALLLIDAAGKPIASIIIDGTDARIMAADLERIAPTLAASPAPAAPVDEGHPRPPAPKKSRRPLRRGHPTPKAASPTVLKNGGPS